jgi:hypothetical protein
VRTALANEMRIKVPCATSGVSPCVVTAVRDVFHVRCDISAGSIEVAICLKTLLEKLFLVQTTGTYLVA